MALSQQCAESAKYWFSLVATREMHFSASLLHLLEIAGQGNALETLVLSNSFPTNHNPTLHSKTSSDWPMLRVSSASPKTMAQFNKTAPPITTPQYTQTHAHTHTHPLYAVAVFPTWMVNPLSKALTMRARDNSGSLPCDHGCKLLRGLNIQVRECEFLKMVDPLLQGNKKDASQFREPLI